MSGVTVMSVYKGTNYGRQLQGAISKAQGGYFEDLITNSCEHYKQIKLANIEKPPEPFRPSKRMGDGKFIGNYTQQAQPDFKGTLRGGRSICFEAKHTDDDRILQKRVTEAQTAALNLHEQLGAACYVFVSIQMQHFYFIPWQVWSAMKECFGHKYMGAAELKPYRVIFDGQKILFLKWGVKNE